MAILNTVLPANITEYPNSFKRQGAFPLERYSVFYAIEADADKGIAAKTAFQAAKDYAQNNPIAYVGQVISVVSVQNNVASVDVYKIVQKLNNNDIIHDLELVGDAEAITAANAAIAGLTTRIQNAETSITTLQEIVNGKGEGEAHVKGLIEKVADAQGLLNNISNTVSTHIEDTKEFNTRISTLESAGYATTGQVATAKQEAIDAAVLRVLGEGVDEDFDTLKEVAQWILSDTSGAANIITRLSNIEKDYLLEADKTELQGNINTVDGKFTAVNQSITNINKLIGDLPEGAVSTTVIAYIKEAIDALKIGDYAKVSVLNELSGTVNTLSGKIDKVSTKADSNETAITSINNKLAGIADDKTVVDLLNGKVDKVEGSRLINASEIAILSKLSLNDGQVEIGGTIAAGSVTGLPQKIADILDSTAEDEGALLSGKVDARHLNSNLAALITGAVQTNKLNSNEFKTETDGTVSLNKVNLSKVEQTEGDWLILNGGDSTNSWN